MWLIAGTLPDPNFPLHIKGVEADYTVDGDELILPGRVSVPIERGTAALAATALLTCSAYGYRPPRLLAAGDTGRGTGSAALYFWLTQHLPKLQPQGITFHYFFPDLDLHNKLLSVLQEMTPPPFLTADAGFMYVAKMSGYADGYDLFTPDPGELAFLADEKAPHPFYTRGFLLNDEENIPELYARAAASGNCPANLIIKGKIDYIICDGKIQATVTEPSVPAMECIGGTGDLVTGLATAFLAGGLSVCVAGKAAAQTARLLAHHCQPTPATQAKELILRLPEMLRELGPNLPVPLLKTN